MKKIVLGIIVIVYFCFQPAISQNLVDGGVFSSATAGQFEVRLRPNFTTSPPATLVTNIQFTIKWPVSSGATMLTNTSGSPFFLTPQSLTTNGGYYYQVFVTTTPYNPTWVANQEYICLTFTYTNNTCPTFEIASDAYTSGMNGTYYVELSGLNKTGILYQASSPAPAVGTPIFSLGATSSRCKAAGSVTYSATAVRSTGINYTLDAASTLAGNSIIPATGAVTYLSGWSGVSTITATATGCSGPSSSTHVVTINPLPAAAAGVDRAICSGASTEIGAASVAGSTYSWTSVPAGFTSTLANPSVSPAVPTAYTVVETCTATTCTNTHSVNVTINPLPDAVAGTDRAICSGGSSQIGSASVAGSTYSWTSVPAGFTSILANPSVSPILTTTYTLVETITLTGCTNTHSVTVTVNPLPAAAAGADRAICSGASTEIGAASVAGSTYSWTSVPVGFTSTAANPSVSPILNTTYTVVETITATGCTTSHSVIITINSFPAAVAGADRAICTGGSSQIGATAVGGSTYSWTSVPVGYTSTTANPSVSPIVTTTYTLVETITAGGCTNTHSVVVTVNPLPDAVAGTDRTICSGASSQIGAASVVGNTYSWTSVPAGFTSTTANPSVSPIVTTTYTVVETITLTGCTNTHSVVVTVMTLPAAIAGADRAICLGTNTQLGAAPVGGSTYSWTSIPAGFTSSSANPTVSPTVNTTYTVVETITAGGCNNTHSVLVTINPNPNALAGSDRTICPGVNTQIGAASIAGNTYSWTSVPVGYTSSISNPVVNPLVTTVYTIVETITATACTNTHNVIVTVSPAPPATAGANRTICLGTTTQIGSSAIPGNTYNWTSVPAGFTSTLANPTATPSVTTTYTLVETVTATGCSNSNSITVIVNSVPSAITGANRSICLGTPTQIGAALVAGNTYSWTSIPAGYTSTVSNPIVNPAISTTYVLVETITATGCSNTNSVIVTVNPLPSAITGSDRTICSGSSTQLGTNTVVGNTYSWSSIPAGFASTISNPTVIPAVSTTYTLLEIVTATGCSNTHNVVISVATLPAAIAGTDRAICLGSNTQIGATSVAGSTYSWTSVPAGFTSTSSNPTVNPTSTTTYTVIETITAGGCNNSHSVVVTVNPLPAAVAGTDRAVCSGSSSQIGGTTVGGSTYSWTSVPAGFTSSIANPSVSPIVTTTYTVAETITATGCSNTHSIIVTVNPLPAAVAGTDRAICAGSSSQIGAASVVGNTYSWTSSPAGFTSSTANPTVNPIVTTTYTILETITATGCTNTHSVIVTVNPLPTAVAGTDRAICAGGSSQIGSASVAGSTYNWTSSPAGFTSTSANPTVSPAVNTTYTLTETITATGCSNTHGVIIAIIALPAAIAGTDRAICLGSSTQLGGSPVGGNTYSWTSVPAGFTSSTANPTVSPIVTTTYTVVETITIAGCTNTHNVIVTVNPLPAAIAGTDRAICTGASSQIGAASVVGSTYSWTSVPAGFTSSTANPTVSPIVTTTYTVVETITATACTNTHSVVVTVNPLPAAIAGTDRAICSGGSSQIGATSVGGSTYNWTSVPVGFTSTTANPTVSPIVTTTYTIVETITATGCTNTHSVIVTVNPLPAAVAGINRSICSGGSSQIGAASVVGSTYSWTSVPAGFTSTSANPTVSPIVTTTYTVVETITATACTNSHSVVVSVTTLPNAIAGADRAICLGTITQLGATPIGGSTYSWTSIPAGFTSTSANPIVSPSVNTTYTLVETITSGGCINTNSVVVTIVPLPAAIAGSNRSICTGTSTQLGATAVAGSTYSWISSPAGFTSNLANPTVNPTISTIYSVTETVISSGCTNSHSVTVTVNPSPAAVSGADRSICNGSITQLGTNAVIGSTYSWTSIPAGFSSTNANPTVNPTVTTIYALTETITSTGCSNFHNTTVTVNPLPVALAGVYRAICIGTSTQIGATPVLGNTYSWTSVPAGFTSTSANPTVNPSLTTTYTLTETITATGCSNTNSVVVTVNPLPAADAGANRAICAGAVSQLGATSNAGSSYLWSSVPVGFTSLIANPTVNPSATTTYNLVETITASGCSNSHSVVVTVNPLPTANAGTDQIIPTGTSAILNGSSSNCSGSCQYAWSPAASLNPPSSFNIVNPATANLASSTTFSLIVTNSVTGCQSIPDAVLISVSGPALTVSATATPSQICTGQSSQLLATASGGTGVFNYSWNSIPAGFTSLIANPVVNPTVSTTYGVTVSDGTNTQSTTVNLTVNALPILTWANVLTAQCINSTTYTLSGGTPSGGTYSGIGVSGTNFNASLTGPGIKTLTYTYTNPVTGCSSSITNTITVNSLPTVSWVSSLASQCVTSTVYTLAGGLPSGGTYSGIGVSGTNFNASLGGSGIKIITYTYTNPSTACSSFATNSITVNPLPVVTWSTSLSPQCITSSSYALTGATPAGGTFSGTGVSGTNFNASAAGTGLKVLTYTYVDPASGCTNSATNTILVNSLPIVTWINSLNAQCITSTSYTLSGGTPSGGTYSGTGVAGNIFNATIAGTGSFVLTYTYTSPTTGCTQSITNTIQVNPLPVVTWTASLTPQCITSSTYTLSGGIPTGGTYSGAGVIGTNFNASLAGAGSKTITYTYTNPSTGCTNSSTNTIVVNILPVVTWSNSLQAQCSNSNTYLLSGGTPTGGTYSGPGVTGGNFNASVAGLGLKTLTYTYTAPATGCTSSSTNTILVNALPTVLWSTLLTPQCINSTTYTLTGGVPSGGTYSGAGVSGNNFNASIAGAGLKTLTYTYTNPVSGCSSLITNTILVNNLPVVSWSNSLNVQCLSSTIYALTGGSPAGGTYNGPGVSGSNFNASTAGVGTHSLVYTYVNTNGCINTAQNTIIVKTTPPATGTITGASAVCNGTSNAVFSVALLPNVSSYSWWINGGAIIVTGQGSNQITVDFTGITGTVYINAMTVNECGSGLMAPVKQVTVNPQLFSDAGLADSLIYGFSKTLQGSASGGLPPYTYSWTPVTGLNNPNIANPIATPLTTTVYKLTVNDATNCTSKDSVRIAVSPPFGNSVSGLVIYNGDLTKPLNNVHLYLKQNSITKYECFSNIFGQYNFAGVLPGIYQLSGTKQLVPDPNYMDGVNAIDALIISSHFVGIIQLTGVRLLAGDVDASHYINATDAFFTLKKFVRLIDSFPAGNWVIDTCTLAVAGNVIRNLEGLNVGDVNASNTNPLKTEPSIAIAEQGYLEIPTSGIFEIPFILNEDLDIGATSVVLNYPKEVYKFLGAEMNSENEKLVYSENDGTIRIGWYSTDGIHLKKGSVLFYLRLQLQNPDVQIPEGISFSTTTESVISDPYAFEYSPVNLVIPHISKQSSSNSEFVLFGNSPNPFSNLTRITYQLPTDGNLSVRIYNSTGELIDQLLNKEFLTSGNYSLEYNGAQLSPGTYWYVFDFRNNSTFVTKSKKMIITR